MKTTLALVTCACALALAAPAAAQTYVQYSGTACVEQLTNDYTYYQSATIVNGSTTNDATVWCPAHKTTNANATYCWNAFVYETGATHTFTCRIGARSNSALWLGASDSSSGAGQATLSEDDLVLAAEALTLQCTMPRCEGSPICAVPYISRYTFEQASCII